MREEYVGATTYYEPRETEGWSSTNGVAHLPPAGAAAPDELLAPLQAGDAAFRASDYADARRHYIRAQLDGVYRGEAVLAYALVHFAEGNYTLAGMALRRGLAELPDAIQQPIDVLWLYGRPGPLEQHLGGLAAYLAEHPANSEGWLILGYVRFGVGDPAGAIEALDRALALDPGDALCHLLRESASAVLDVRAGPVEGGDSASAAVAPIYWSAMSPQAPY